MLQNGQRTTAIAASTLEAGTETGRFDAGDEVTFRIAFDNVFSPDRYYRAPGVAGPSPLLSSVCLMFSMALISGWSGIRT